MQKENKKYLFKLIFLISLFLNYMEYFKILSQLLLLSILKGRPLHLCFYLNIEQFRKFVKFELISL